MMTVPLASASGRHCLRHGDHLWLTAQGHSAADCFAAIAGQLRRHGAWLLQERVFADDDGSWRRARKEAYAGVDDALPPLRLGPPAGRAANSFAIVAQALIGFRPGLVRDGDGRPCGRRWCEGDGSEYLAVGPVVSSSPRPDAGGEADACFAWLADLLAREGGSLRSLVRTWIWMADILGWYGDFNRARTRAFTAARLIAPDDETHLPASTGVGISPPRGRIAIEGLAMLRGKPPRLREMAGNQSAAFSYGSAFSRAVQVDLGGAAHLLVSGTAAIDARGRTMAVGDPAAQAACTLANIRAVLAEHGSGDEQVLQATVYAATPEAARAWLDLGADWPAVVVTADICRNDLLIEAEVVAALD